MSKLVPPPNSFSPPPGAALPRSRERRSLWLGVVLAGVLGGLAATLGVFVSPALGIVLGLALPALAPWLAFRLTSEPPSVPAPSLSTSPSKPRDTDTHGPPARLEHAPGPAADGHARPSPETTPSTEPTQAASVRISGSWRTDNLPQASANQTALALMLTQASLRQIGLGLERLVDHTGRSPFIDLMRGSLGRAREAFALFQPKPEPRPDQKASTPREPFALREELVAVARAVGFELGREIALRFSAGFPAQTVGDRSVFRHAITVSLLEGARYLEQTRHDPLTQHTIEPLELLVEANHEDIASQRALIRVVVDAQPDVPVASPPGPLPTLPPYLQALDAMLRKASTQAGIEPKVSPIIGSPDGRRFGFTLPVVRYKRLTGTTLFGMGALADRSVLVIEPRTLSRVSICEALASWRLRPTAVSTVEDAVTLLTERSDSRPLGRFDMVVLAAGAGDEHCPLHMLAEHMQVFERLPIVTLEGLECLARPLPEGLERLSIKRLPRPLGPTDLLEVATGALAPAPRAASSASSPSGGTRPASSGLTVLVAEDNPVNQAFIVKLLERRGVSIILANNGADALDRVQETPDEFDAILMDLQMPVMDGYEAAAVLRLREAQASARRIPIIAITAHALDGERERCLEAGMDDYLSKPVDEAGLFAALDRVTRRSAEADKVVVQHEAFDRARVLDFAAGDKSFLTNLVALFADTSPRQLEAIRAAIESGSGLALYRAAHQLKGSVSNFGAANAYALAGQLEALGKTETLDGAAAILESLEAELAAVRVGLARLLTEMG